MKRFNYLARQRRPLAERAPVFAIDGRIRGPLAALAFTTVLTAFASWVQLERLGAARDDYAHASTALVAARPAVDAVIALRARIMAQGRLADDVAAQRAAALTHANELAWIGNHLPPRTWLEALRYESGVYSLTGSSERAESVGDALLALHDPVHAMTPQLLSLQQLDSDATPRIRYRLRITIAR